MRIWNQKSQHFIHNHVVEQDSKREIELNESVQHDHAQACYPFWLLLQLLRNLQSERLMKTFLQYIKSKAA